MTCSDAAPRCAGVTGAARGKRRALAICGVVVLSLLVFELAAGCGRKKPPLPLNPEAGRIQYRIA